MAFRISFCNILMATLSLGFLGCSDAVSPPADPAAYNAAEQAKAMGEAANNIAKMDWLNFAQAHEAEPGGSDARAAEDAFLHWKEKAAIYLTNQVIPNPSLELDERLLAVMTFNKLADSINHAEILSSGLAAIFDLREATGAPPLGDPRLIDLLKRLKKVSPSDAGVCYYLGDELVGAGQPREALVALEKAVELDPQFVNAWYVKSLTHRQVGELEKALEGFSHCLELDPTYNDVRQARSVTLHDLGRNQEALEDLNVLAKSGVISDKYEQLRLSLEQKLSQGNP